jgi:hypothetical protein
LLVSPFVGEDWISSRIGAASGSILISREEELLKLSQSLISKLECYYVGVPDLPPDPDEDQSQEALGERPELSGLHAKVFVMDDGWNAHAFVGSANATDGAYRLNVEFMVELIGKKSVLGIKTFFDPQNEKGGLGPLLVRYQPASDQGRPDPMDEIRRLSETLKFQIADTGLRGRVLPSVAGEESYSLEIDSRPGAQPLPENVEVYLWPVTLGEGRGVQLKNSEESVHIEFGELSLLQLTAFFAVKALLKDRPDLHPIQFALLIPVEGFPPTRQEALLRSMLSDSNSVARYLAMLLAPEDGLSLGMPMGVIQLGPAESGSWKVQDAGLFEALLGALHSDPQQLRYIDRFVQDFRVDPKNGQDFLPKGFLEIWAAVKEAALDAVR